ncbi:probable cytochrome P450 28a5 isoform X1 [Phlebotomus argentipes]|uniref:probable cytochrome P450 28a5 isoform X1 n=1 Tax=Phlebotomus argentipes TaxID=94469 RepID=UPI002892C145|nr:probable cytochrome P450 28a5 isoform X1 [Phlebotomus argentipes]
MFQEIVYFLSGLGIILYVYLTWNHDYWKKRKIPGPEPRFLLGNVPSLITAQKFLAYEMDDLYKKYKDRYKFIGFMNMRSPNILALDPTIIKEMLIKNFRFFSDNTFANFTDKEVDPIFGRNPFMLKGNEWKEKRQEITPAFTVSRIKTMYPVVEDVCSAMKDYIKREKKNNAQGFEGKELCAKFTTDVVSNCIFGLDAGSFTQEKPIIREMGKELFTPSIRILVFFFLQTVIPAIKYVYKMPFVPKHVEKFFVKIMKDAIALRRKTDVNRFDYLHFLLELQEKKNLNELDMVAHAVTFFIDGFETSSIALTFTLFEIARHKNVQDKLRNEIRETLAKHGKITHDVVSEMPYLDQVFMESLRLYPPASFLAKTVTEQTELKLSEGEYRTIEKGMEIFVPLYSIHRDPEYYYQPEDFIPERFDPENGGVKAFRDKGVLIPFGDGPRICLGQRFAMAQVKAAIVSLVNEFELSVNPKTKTPLIFDPKQFLIYPYGGIWLDFKEL